MLSTVKLAKFLSFLQFIKFMNDDFLTIWVGEFEPVRADS